MIRCALAVLVLATLVGACSSSSDDTTTTTPGTEVSVDEMCRTLSLFVNAGTSPGHASEGITQTDLATATSEELAAYGEVLVLAPQTACPDLADYADEVAYWLGF
jgi:hypothetical protein